MKFKVEGVNTFPGRFIESEARRADSGDGPLALICVGEAAAEAAEPEEADCVVAVGTADLGADRLREACNRAGKPLALLRCAPMIGTGMTGRWRDMVNAIYRGIYLRVDGNKARASMVHALDVGRAAVMSAGMNGAWWLSDGRDHLVDDAVAALAKRINDKRVVRMSLKKARRTALLLDIVTLGGAHARERLCADTSDSLVDARPLLDAIGLEPRDTLEYISTHVYSDEDL